VTVKWYGGNITNKNNIKPVGTITTHYVPYIIDYGFSHVRINNVNFGKHGYESANVYVDKSFPMYDLYKMLCGCELRLLSYDQKHNVVVNAEVANLLSLLF